MTEEYNKNLLEYITNNIQETSPTTEEIFKEKKEIPRNKYVYKYSPNGWYSMKIEGFIKPNENNGNIGVLYGGYREYKEPHDSYGFIILVDQNMEPIKYIDSYDSGTKLRYIQCMIQGDNNLFYAIDDAEMSFKNNNISNTEKRFLILNNFIINSENNYKVILKKSYIFKNSEYQNFYCKNIYKKPGESNFVFCGDYAFNSTSNATRIKAIQLIINVGESNEWNYWYISNNIQGVANFVKFNDENVKIQFLGISTAGKYVYLFTKDYNQTSLNSSIIHTFDYNISTAALDDMNQQALYLDEDNIYFIIDNQRLTGKSVVFKRHIGLFHYTISNKNFETIYDNYIGDTVEIVNIEKIQIDKNQGDLYIAYYNNFNDNKADYYFQRYNNLWNPILVGEQKTYSTSLGNNYRGLYVNNKYNLLIVALYPDNWSSNYWYFAEIKEVYNKLQYNGEAYVNEDSLCPLYSNLYSDGSLIFSRNLYNISKQSNMTVSSVEIPNTYLNDINININELISKTNQTLNENNISWSKNIYEIVDLNFLNTISIINEDTGDTYLDGAIKLNNSTTDGGIENYQNTACTKYKINYIDGTKKIGSINWSYIDILNKKTSMTIYVDKEISSLDLISNDETTIYLNIPLEVDVGKTYSIKQKIRIGG